jgi:hypothetical protein
MLTEPDARRDKTTEAGGPRGYDAGKKVNVTDGNFRRGKSELAHASGFVQSRLRIRPWS